MSGAHPSYQPSRTPDAAYQEIANNVSVAICSTLVHIQTANQTIYPNVDTTDAAAVISGAFAGTLEFAMFGLNTRWEDIRERVIAQLDMIGAQMTMELASGGKPEGRA